MKTMLMALAPAFEQRSGHRLVVDNDTAGALSKRILGGEAFALVLLTPAALKTVSARVAPGAPTPDISSVAAFQAAHLNPRPCPCPCPAGWSHRSW